MKYYGSKYIWMGLVGCVIGQLLILAAIFWAIWVFVGEMRYQDVMIATHSYNVRLQWEAIDELKKEYAKAMQEMGSILHNKKLEKLRVVGEDGSYISIVMDPRLEDFIVSGVEEIKSPVPKKGGKLKGQGE